jgi:hypothetical protein
MGNFVDGCGKKKYDMQIDQLSTHLKISNKTLQQTKNNNLLLQDEISSLSEQVAILENKALKLSGMLKHYDEILGSASVIADSIIESDLNCKWLDDNKEKEYISSIVKFIHDACNDITCGFDSTKKHVKKRPKSKKTTTNLKKLDTLNKLMIEIEQSRFDIPISPLSLT